MANYYRPYHLGITNEMTAHMAFGGIWNMWWASPMDSAHSTRWIMSTFHLGNKLGRNIGGDICSGDKIGNEHVQLSQDFTSVGIKFVWLAWNFIFCNSIQICRWDVSVVTCPQTISVLQNTCICVTLLAYERFGAATTSITIETIWPFPHTMT